jgi:hypothetical protein
MNQEQLFQAVLGRYLGPTDPGVGSTMTAKILKSNGEVVRRYTFRLIRPEELDTEENKRFRAEFDESVSKRLGQPLNDEAFVTPTLEVAAVVPDYERYEDENNPAEPAIDSDDIGDLENPEAYDGYIASQVMLPREDQMLLATVRKRATNEMGAPIGTANTNPIMDTRVIEVEFDDGVVLEYAANVLAENLYTQVNQEGHLFMLLDSIVDHKRHSSAETTNFIEVNGRQCRRVTTKGWNLCVQWKDGTTS